MQELLNDSESKSDVVDLTQSAREECESDIDSEDNYVYSIKIINPMRMKEFQTINLGKGGTYKSTYSLRQYVSKNLPNTPVLADLDLFNVEIGYMEPGHGMKGRKLCLYDDNDITKLYKKYLGKPTIRMWCYSSKKVAKDGPSSATTNSISNSKEEKDVSTIYEVLKEKHDGAFTDEQLHTWSCMLKVKSHNSYENPPDKLFLEVINALAQVLRPL